MTHRQTNVMFSRFVRAPMIPLLATLVVTGGCAHRAARVANEPPIRAPQHASLEQLLEALRAQATSDEGWTGKGRLVLDDLRAGTSREVTVRIAARKPAELRMQGTKTLLPTLFVLVANERGTWLDVPSRKQTYLLPAGAERRVTDDDRASLLALDAADLLRAIVPDPPHPRETWSLVEAPYEYVLTGHHLGDGLLEPTRQLVFDRAELSLVRQQIYGANGKLTSRSRFVPGASGAPLPRSVRIERPFERMALSLRLEDGELATLSEKVFQFKMPRGRELVDVSAGDVTLPQAIPAAAEQPASERANPS